MYCSHCGYKLKDKTVDTKMYQDHNRTKDSVETFVCPRCGKVIKEDLNEEEVKDLARASHSEIHKSRNNLNSGLCFLVITFILIGIAITFFLMSFKKTQGGKLVTDCSEFYLFCALSALSVVTISYSIFRLTLGIKMNIRYKKVLKDIQNGTFIQ